MNRFAMIFAVALGLAGACSLGCSHEVSHKETDKPGLFGGHTHTEETTVEHSDGSVSTEKSKQHVSN